MPTFAPGNLLQALLLSYEESGATATVISPETQRHPRILLVQTPQQVIEVWVYLWTLTHGGGAKRPLDEFRIQLTSVTSPLRTNPGGPTLLLGYDPDRRCFAGFDVRKHIHFTGRSPSIQIRIPALDEALLHGLAFARKENDEIAVAFRPDYLLIYTLNGEMLHSQAVDPKTVELMAKIADEVTVEPQEIEQVTPERQRVVTTVARLTRAANFRRRVMHAYNSTCVVTGLQLRLVDAAHILPVGAEGSTDATTNGMCLSSTYHRAFDSALIFLDEDYTMRLNPRRAEELRAEGLDAGLGLLAAHLDRPILLPADDRLWPDKALIRRANHFRQVR